LSEIRALLDKARRAFAAADRLLRDGDSDFAASRGYYGYFYVAQALLLSKGLEFSRHGQVVAQYGLHFAKNAELDPRFHRLLDRAFTFRQRADYSATSLPDPELVEELIREGFSFLAAAEDFLG
jgi:uncharacterized protein (UPF0332 family)